MLKPHFTFQKRQNEMREHRLVFDKEKTKGDAYDQLSSLESKKEKLEPNPNLNYARWQEVFSTLRKSTMYQGDTKAQKLLQDDKILDMIASQVTIRVDGRVRWLPETAQVFADKYLSVFLNEQAKLEQAYGNATDFAQKFAADLQKNIDDITTALQKHSYQDSLLPNGDEVLKILRETLQSAPALEDRQRVLIDIANAIIKADSIGENVLDTLLKDFKEKKHVQIVLEDLRRIAREYAGRNVVGSPTTSDKGSHEDILRQEHPQLFAQAQRALLDAVVAGGRAMLLNTGKEMDPEKHAERLQVLKDAKTDTETKLQSLGQRRKDLIDDTQYSKSEDLYMEWLTGKSFQLRLSSCIRLDGRLDTNALLKEIESMKREKKITLDELIADLGIADAGALDSRAADLFVLSLQAEHPNVQVETVDVINATKLLLREGFASVKKAYPYLEKSMISELLGVWNTAPFFAKLKEKGILTEQDVDRNHITSSLSNIVLRTYLGRDAAKQMVEQGIDGLRMSSLIDLSEITRFKLGRDELRPTEELMNFIASKQATFNKRLAYRGNFIHFVRYISNCTNAQATQAWKNLIGNEPDAERVQVDESDLEAAIRNISINADSKQLVRRLKLDVDNKLVVDDSLLNNISTKSGDDRIIRRADALHLLQLLFAHEAEAKWRLLIAGQADAAVVTLPSSVLTERLQAMDVQYWGVNAVTRLQKDIQDSGTNVVDPKLLSAVSENADANGKHRRVHKEHFIQMVTFLYIGDAKARKKATSLWNTFPGAQGGDDPIELPIMTLEAALQRIDISRPSMQYMKVMHDKNLAQQPFTKDIADLSLQGLATVTEGTAKWWEWVRQMPGYYFGSSIDPQLLAMDNEEKALRSYGKAIDSTLAMIDTQKKPIAAARDELMALNTAQRKGREKPPTANGAIDNVEQAYTMVQASAYVIEQLRTQRWDSLPEDAQMTAFSIAMRSESGNGIEEAKRFMSLYEKASNEAAGLPFIVERIPAATQRMDRIMGHVPQSKLNQIRVMSDFNTMSDEAKAQVLFEALSPEERRGLFMQVYLKGTDQQIADGRENFRNNRRLSGKSVLEGPRYAHGLDVRPDAMHALMERIRGKCPDLTMLQPYENSMRIERWVSDRASVEAHKPIAEAISLVVMGPEGAKKALVNAFLTQEDVDYDHTDGTKKKLTAVEANAIISQIKADLTRKAAEPQRAREQLSGSDVRSNPIERGLRSTLETVKELWEGDWVNKATVIATLLVSLHVIRKAWKEAGNKDAPGWMKLLKAGLIATPLLIVGNAAVKRSTGKDYLGEWFSYMPKEKRNSALESFRRRSAEKSDYDFMDSVAGHEALRQLTGPKSDIHVCDLIKWRESVRLSSNNDEMGSDVYANGAPEGLRINSIRSALPSGSTKDEAYKVAFLAFEALCVDVAEIKGLGGGTNADKAERGADYIERKYVGFEDYADLPDVQQRQKLRKMNMLQIIIDVSNTPESLDAVKDNPNFVEWLAEKMGWTIKKTKEKLVQLSTQAQVHMLRARELVPEYWQEAWGLVKEGTEDIYDWYRKTQPKLVHDLGKGIDASWKTFLDTCDAAGIVVKKGVPGAVEFAVDGTAKVTDYSLDIAQRLYELSREHQTIGNVVSGIDTALEAVFGANIANLVALRNTVKNDGKHVEALAKNERMEKELRSTLSPVVDLPQDFSNVLLKAKGVAQTELGLGNDPSKLSSYETMAVTDLMKRRIYSAVIARRIEELQDLKGDQLKSFAYPLKSDKIWKWKNLGGGDASPLAEAIESTYGFNTLSLIGLEQNFSGEYQQWVERYPEGAARKPLAFLDWVLERSTFTDARRYLEHDIELIRKQFLRQADEAFKDLKPEEKATKLRLYTFYLETLLTNVAMEMALGLPNKGNTAPGGPNKMPLALLNAQAKELLDYVVLYRGSSARPSELKGVDFEPFESKGGVPKALEEINKDPQLRSIISSSDPAAWTPPAVAAGAAPAGSPNAGPSRLASSQVDSLEKKIGDSAFDMSKDENQKELLKQLSGVPPDLQLKIHDLFDKRASEFLNALGSNVPGDGDRPEIYRLLRGVSEGSAEKNRLRDSLLKGMDPGTAEISALDLSRLVELAKQREVQMSATELARFQDVLDRAAIHYLDYIAKYLENKHFKDKASIEAFGRGPLRETYTQKLAELYKATSAKPDSVSDTVSQLIEIVHYLGDYRGYDDYATYLKGLGIKNPPDQAKYSYDKGKSGFWFEDQNGPRRRLAKTVPFNPNDLSASGFQGRLNAIKGQRGM